MTFPEFIAMVEGPSGPEIQTMSRDEYEDLKEKAEAYQLRLVTENGVKVS
jgi:hypothetical protein